MTTSSVPTIDLEQLKRDVSPDMGVLAAWLSPGFEAACWVTITNQSRDAVLSALFDRGDITDLKHRVHMAIVDVLFRFHPLAPLEEVQRVAMRVVSKLAELKAVVSSSMCTSVRFLEDGGVSVVDLPGRAEEMTPSGGVRLRTYLEADTPEFWDVGMDIAGLIDTFTDEVHESETPYAVAWLGLTAVGLFVVERALERFAPDQQGDLPFIEDLLQDAHNALVALGIRVGPADREELDIKLAQLVIDTIDGLRRSHERLLQYNYWPVMHVSTFVVPMERLRGRPRVRRRLASRPTMDRVGGLGSSPDNSVDESPRDLVSDARAAASNRGEDELDIGTPVAETASDLHELISPMARTPVILSAATVSLLQRALARITPGAAADEVEVDDLLEVVFEATAMVGLWVSPSASECIAQSMRALATEVMQSLRATGCQSVVLDGWPVVRMRQAAA